MNLGLRQVRQVRDVFMFCRHWSLSRPRAVAVLRSLTTHNLLWGGVGVYLAVAGSVAGNRPLVEVHLSTGPARCALAWCSSQCQLCRVQVCDNTPPTPRGIKTLCAGDQCRVTRSYHITPASCFR